MLSKYSPKNLVNPNCYLLLSWLSFGQVHVWGSWHCGSALVWYWLGLISGASHQWHCVSLFAVAALHPLLSGSHSQHANATLTPNACTSTMYNLNVFCFASNSHTFVTVAAMLVPRMWLPPIPAHQKCRDVN